MAEKENLTRWVWDLFPLSKDSWGAWQLANDEDRPDQRVFVRRYHGDGYLGPPVSMDMLARMMEQGHAPEDFAQREGYVPTQDDVDLLKRQYPNSNPYQPVWRTIKSDLVAAGHVPDSMQGHDVPTLLRLLKRSESPDAPEDDETKTASPKRKKVGRTAAAPKEIKSRAKLAGRENTDAIIETDSDAQSDDRTEVKSDDDLPKSMRADSPSRLKARAAFDYAMERIPNANAMTASELFDAINKNGEAAAMLPPTVESFTKYLNDCGIRLKKSGPKTAGGSVVRQSDL